MLSSFSDVVVVDGDAVMKRLIVSEEHRVSIQRILEKTIVVEGELQYRVIENVIAGNPEKKRAFEAYVGPYLLGALKEGDRNSRVMQIVELSSLFESRWDSWFDGVIVASCPKREQLRRIRASGTLSEVEMCTRLKYQMPVSKKEARAHFVIQTDCESTHLRERVSALHRRLREWRAGSVERRILGNAL
jgi:dephospho-CoA kinase